MSSAPKHLDQAKRNFEYLMQVNQVMLNTDSNREWQSTIAFYIALHLVRYHLLQCKYTENDTENFTHLNIEKIINSRTPLTKRGEKINDAFTQYKSLRAYSEQARYKTISISDYELSIVFEDLDKILHYFNTRYSLNWGNISINCAELEDYWEGHHIKKIMQVDSLTIEHVSVVGTPTSVNADEEE